MEEKSHKGIIVLGGHVQALGIIRILGREGIPAIIIDNTSKNIARHSKYCLESFKIDDSDLLSFLTGFGIIKKYSGWVIFPTNDFHVKLLSYNKVVLANYFTISTDNWSTIEVFYNKRLTYKLAEKLQIPIPKTFFPSSESDLENIEIEFPCIIKPAVMHDFYRKVKKKVFVCANFDELKTLYHKAINIIPSDEIILQEIIQGPSKNQFSACFLFLNGKAYISLTACRMRQHPLDFGNATTYAETIDMPILINYAEKILIASSYNGVCEVEFKLDDRDNKIKFLEVNTRTWKWHTIANKTETPFLKLYFDYLTGITIQPIQGFKNASYSHFLTDFTVQLQLLFKGYSYWKRKFKPIEHAVWAGDDPKPWFFEKIYLGFFIFNR